MINDDFYASWSDCFDVTVDINWTTPECYENIASLSENDTAYFYAIVSELNGDWEVYYIGMTYNQSVAVRTQQPDHRNRLMNLCNKYPEQEFRLSLGTPNFKGKKLTKKRIEIIEGLLIYGNWHEKMINNKKIQQFKALTQIYINNIGWTRHIKTELAYGVFSRSE